MWFKNLFVYRLTNWKETAESLEDKLAQFSLQPLSGLEMQNRGWVSVKDEQGPFVHELNSQLLIAFGTEKKLLPTTVVNQFAKQRALEIEERDGFKPGRKRMKELKEEITDELLPRAFALRSKVLGWVDPKNGWLVIDAASATRADDLAALLIRSVPGIALSLLKTKLAPTLAMTTWLAEDDNPPGFSIDRDCELKGRGEDASTVRYVKHTLAAEDVQAHIKAGKDVTRLALTWADRISFVLQENLQIKRVAPLDIIKEQADTFNDDDTFNADFGLMVAEFQKLIPAIVDVLGGELQSAQAA